MKTTWKILNNIIKPNTQHTSLPEYFMYNETVMNNSIDVATCRIMQSMFLGEVQEN